MPVTLTRKAEFFVGLDLGQAQDPSALAVLERSTAPDPADATCDLTHYAIPHLERWPLGTAYPAIIQRVVSLFAKPPLQNATLVVDHTGVGRAVVDLLRDAKAQGRLRANLKAVTITGGHAVSFADDGSFHVAKKHLVGALQVLFQSRRLRFARDLRLAEVFIKELNNFRVKMTAVGNETYEAWREGDHDDLVLAVAIAAWRGEREKTPWITKGKFGSIGGPGFQWGDGRAFPR